MNIHYYHPYLSDYQSYERLMDEYDKHGGLVVAYDFDGTVHDFHKEGHNYIEIYELLRAAKEIGCYMIVFTAEEDLKKVKTHLKGNNLPFDAINENPPFWKSKARKIYYNILLDDRAGLRSAYWQLSSVIENVKHRKQKELAEKKNKSL